jgi:hypothetical protein
MSGKGRSMADFGDFGRGCFGFCRGYFGVKNVVEITTSCEKIEKGKHELLTKVRRCAIMVR